jgi:uncharacterized protein (DUF1697 family)
MPTHIALLRGINVGGHNLVAMSDLRDFLTALGCEAPRSLLQSGNLVFQCASRPRADLERWLETEAEKRLGLRTDFHVRAAKEWENIIANNPFPEEAKRDPAHLVVMFLKRAPDQRAVKALQAAIKGREIVRADGTQAYITYPDGIGPSRLTNALIDKELATRCTGRNWNTVVKLAAQANG